MAKRAGDFQLSIGLIVVVVFAVIFLSLGINWVNQFMSQMTTLTDDLTQQAQNKIQETFQSSDNSFAVWPDQYTLGRGKTLKLSAGIRNNAADGLNHLFVINVIPADTSTRTWVQFDTFPITIMINSVGYRPITVTVPSNARAGTYLFYIVACKDMSSESCTLETLNWGGSAQPLRITVE